MLIVITKHKSTVFIIRVVRFISPPGNIQLLCITYKNHSNGELILEYSEVQ